MTELLTAATSFAERLRPDTTPQMGFQSYELFAGDAKNRGQQQEQFLAGQIRNPQFEYPKLSDANLGDSIEVLNQILVLSRELSDSDAADAIWDTTSYRMAEMYWLLEAKRLNELAIYNPDSDDFRRSAVRYQQLNEELYGVPDPEIDAAVVGEIIAQVQEKELHPSVQVIYDELAYGGTTMLANGEVVEFTGIGDSVVGTRLPSDIPEKLHVFREVLLEETINIKNLVDMYWEEVCLPRAVAAGTEPGFTTDDMKLLFTDVHAMYDPDNTSGISVSIHEGSAQLAWDTPSMSIRIGANRAPITSPDDMYAKIIHEYIIHAGRAVEGLKTELPILGTGVYSAADKGEESDYLTFEEGFASLAEIAVDDSFSGWKPLHISRYLAVMSAYGGADFRQAFEVNWRARVVMAVASGEDVDEALIRKEKKQASLSVTRVYRGTPTHVETDQVLTFNKDLAYLKGKLTALRFLERVGDDKAEIRRVMRAKIDPNNHRQYELMERYGRV